MKNLFLSLIVGIAVIGLYNYSYGNYNDDPKNSSACICESCESSSSCSGSCDGTECHTMTEFKKEPMKMSSGMSDETALTDDKCPVSGEMLGENPATFSYMGKEYKFCCKGCVAEFRQEPMDYVTETILCPTEGGAAVKEVSLVYEGTKYYFCCEGCDKEFLNNPDKYLSKYSSEE